MKLVNIHLFEEFDHLYDCYAIAFQVFKDDEWCTFGYVPKIDIPKVKKVSIKSIIKDFHPPVQCSVFKAKCSIVKKCKWYKSEFSYVYNCDLTKFGC